MFNIADLHMKNTPVLIGNL